MLRKNPVHPAARDAASHTPQDPNQPASTEPKEVSFSAPDAPAPAPAPITQTQSAPPAQPVAPSLTAAEVAEMRRQMVELEGERTRLQQAAEDRERAAELRAMQQSNAQIEELRRQLDAQKNELSTFHAQQAERELEDMFKIDRSALSHLDSETADELTNTILKPVMDRVRNSMNSRFAQVNDSVAKLETEFNKRYADLSEKDKTAARVRINERLLHAIPDFEALNATAAFGEFKKRVPPGGRQSFGDAMTDAYQAGDVDYIVEQVKVFRDGRPRLTDVADVDLSRESSIQAQSPSQDTARYTYRDLDEAKTKFQRGVMDRQTYRKFLESFQAAEKAGKVS